MRLRNLVSFLGTLLFIGVLGGAAAPKGCGNQAYPSYAGNYKLDPGSVSYTGFGADPTNPLDASGFPIPIQIPVSLRVFEYGFERDQGTYCHRLVVLSDDPKFQGVLLDQQNSYDCLSSGPGGDSDPILNGDAESSVFTVTLSTPAELGTGEFLDASGIPYEACSVDLGSDITFRVSPPTSELDKIYGYQPPEFGNDKIDGSAWEQKAVSLTLEFRMYRQSSKSNGPDCAYAGDEAVFKAAYVRVATEDEGDLHATDTSSIDQRIDAELAGVPSVLRSLFPVPADGADLAPLFQR